MSLGGDVNNVKGQYLGPTMVPLPPKLNGPSSFSTLGVGIGMGAVEPGSCTVYDNPIY